MSMHRYWMSAAHEHDARPLPSKVDDTRICRCGFAASLRRRVGWRDTSLDGVGGALDCRCGSSLLPQFQHVATSGVPCRSKTAGARNTRRSRAWLVRYAIRIHELATQSHSRQVLCDAPSYLALFPPRSLSRLSPAPALLQIVQLSHFRARTSSFLRTRRVRFACADTSSKNRTPRNVQGTSYAVATSIPRPTVPPRLFPAALPFRVPHQHPRSSQSYIFLTSARGPTPPVIVRAHATDPIRLRRYLAEEPHAKERRGSVHPAAVLTGSPRDDVSAAAIFRPRGDACMREEEQPSYIPASYAKRRPTKWLVRACAVSSLERNEVMTPLHAPLPLPPPTHSQILHPHDRSRPLHPPFPLSASLGSSPLVVDHFARHRPEGERAYLEERDNNPAPSPPPLTHAPRPDDNDAPHPYRHPIVRTADTPAVEFDKALPNTFLYKNTSLPAISLCS
ncbi:hypothetical protein B0H11DRAFT_2224724 [Mycena galericulata]|nr:hypothetical protein B0H11DRAFT_2224724 [Mycena galericulata]